MTPNPLDDFLPEWDVAERHETRVGASPAVTYRSLRSIDMGRSRVIRTLFRLRGMPASALNFDGLQRIRFPILRDEPPSQLFLGVIGRFWTLSGDLQRFEPSEFPREYPGFAKAAWGFVVAPESGGGSLLTTETRVLCPDPKSARRFKRYWVVVRPFSVWIRREVLRIVRAAAESSTSATH